MCLCFCPGRRILGAGWSWRLSLCHSWRWERWWTRVQCWLSPSRLNWWWWSGTPKARWWRETLWVLDSAYTQCAEYYGYEGPEECWVVHTSTWLHKTIRVSCCSLLGSQRYFLACCSVAQLPFSVTYEHFSKSPLSAVSHILKQAIIKLRFRFLHEALVE